MSHSCPPLHAQQTLQDLQVGLAWALWSHCFCPGCWYTWDLCALSKSGGCFPESCGTPAIKPQWLSKPNVLGALPPHAKSQAWGDWHNVLSCGRTSSIKLFSSLWLTHLDGMVFDYSLFIYLFTLQYCVGFAILQHESWENGIDYILSAPSYHLIVVSSLCLWL